MGRRNEYIRDEGWKWANQERDAASWLKKNPIRGLDTRMYTLGQVISSIMGDDSNCINPSRNAIEYPDFPDDLRRRFFNDGRLKILDRLDWERSEGVLPVDVQARLEQVHNGIASQLWTDEPSVRAAYMMWLPLKELVSRRAEQEEPLKKALRYYKRQNSRVMRTYAKECTDS